MRAGHCGAAERRGSSPLSSAGGACDSAARNRGSAADPHPADPPAMAVPETLFHPFATAKIVVTPVTWSVIAGPIIVARSRDACSNATLRACRRRGERTSDRCDRDEGSKCLLHSRALLQDDAFGQRRNRTREAR